MQYFRQNISTTGNDIQCRQVTSETVEINLADACAGHFLISACPALFISVEGTGSATEDAFRCNDFECRFPDSFRFGVSTENLACFSGAERTVAAYGLMLVLALIVTKFV